MGRIYRNCILCRNNARRGEISQVAFHRFPADIETHYIWMKICGLTPNMDDVHTLFVCSDHFVEDDYRNPKARESGKSLQLKPGAFPTIAVPNPANLILMETTYVGDTFNSPASSSKEESKEEVAIASAEEILLMSSDTQVIHDSDSETQLPSTPKRKRLYSPRYVGDLSSPDVTTPRQAKQSLQLASDTIKKKTLQTREITAAKWTL